MFLAQVIQAEIGDDAIDPGVERALEAEARQIDVGAKKGFLIDVLTIFLRAGEMDRQAQHGAIILPHQFFEGGGVALLGFADQRGVIHPVDRATLRLAPDQHSGVQIGRLADLADLRHGVSVPLIRLASPPGIHPFSVDPFTPQTCSPCRVR